jgi:restriction system protein
MVGRADKGLLITTGNFTKESVREATRDGAPAIDLIDGDLLINKLKELSLGVETKKVEVEQVNIDSDWFSNL